MRDGQAKLKVEIGVPWRGYHTGETVPGVLGDSTHEPMCWEWSLWERWEERQRKTEEPAWEGHELKCLEVQL